MASLCVRGMIAVLCFAAAPVPVPAAMEDDPLLTKLTIDQLEVREAESANITVWDADFWIGRDLHKVWIKSEGERAGGDTEGAELQLLYTRAASPYWDFQIGWRRDWRPEPQRDYLVLGFEGLAPYFLETKAAIFIREGGRLGLRVEAGYELLFTQKVVLEPEVELSFHSYNDPGVGVGSGLSNIEIGLRLHYGITKQFVPYIGVNWERKFGDTANHAREGEPNDDFQWIVGVSMWI